MEQSDSYTVDGLIRDDDHTPLLFTQLQQLGICHIKHLNFTPIYMVTIGRSNRSPGDGVT